MGYPSSYFVDREVLSRIIISYRAVQILPRNGDPKLVLDATGTIVADGSAVATAGLSTLVKTAWDRLFRSKDPCGKAIEVFL